ncbi:hypothetical protein ANAEL_04984 [Anaerolineales bacterium]|nr:hypothetical protein ANAEL_04984 [Anaerolineales bacterium]
MSGASPLFEVFEYGELHALLRVVVAAKFRPVAQDPELWSSPTVHRLTERLRDAILDADRAKHGQATAELWYKSLSENELSDIVKENLKRNASEPWWRDMSWEAKEVFVRGCVQPFSVTTEFIRELIREAET